MPLRALNLVLLFPSQFCSTARFCSTGRMQNDESFKNHFIEICLTYKVVWLPFFYSKLGITEKFLWELFLGWCYVLLHWEIICVLNYTQFNVHNWMGLGISIHPWNHHHYQDANIFVSSKSFIPFPVVVVAVVIVIVVEHNVIRSTFLTNSK